LRRDPVRERLAAREAELEVRTAEAGRARATVGRILDAAHNTVLVAMDPDFRVTHFNVGAEELLGYSQSEVLGRSVAAYLQPDEVDRHATRLDVEQDPERVVTAMVAAGGHHDWTVPTRTGEMRTLALTFTEIRDRDALIGYVCAGDDVTDRKRTEAALTDALRRELESVARLEEADRLKDEVVSTISHELRTPIASIRGYAELLADGDLGDLSSAQAEAVAKVIRNTARLSDLVGDLLHLDRVEAGAVASTQRSIDFAQVARDAWEDVKQAARGRELDLTLTANGPAHVRGDPGALERVVINLGTNAVKFTPDGGTVTASVEKVGHRAVLTVSDTGIGIDPVDQPHVVKRFFRSPEAFRHAVPGTGLGLSVVDAIVAEHEGSLDIASTPGRGTTVRVELPLDVSPPDRVSARARCR
jgi:PAS domain S-box-containing protein